MSTATPDAGPVQPAPPLLVIPATNFRAHPVNASQALVQLANAAAAAQLLVDRDQLSSIIDALTRLRDALQPAENPAGLVTPPAAGRLHVPGRDS